MCLGDNNSACVQELKLTKGEKRKTLLVEQNWIVFLLF